LFPDTRSAKDFASEVNAMPEPHTILINVEYPEPLIQQIRQSAPKARVLTRSELRAEPTVWRDAEILLTLRVSPEHLAQASRLRWIQTLGAGVDHLLSPALATRSELTITNASGVHAEPIAEHSFMLMLALARRLPRVLALQRERHWDGEPFRENLPTLAGSTLGILGVGAIGQHIAQLGAAFGMRVLGMRRSGAPAPHVEQVFKPSGLHALLRESEYIVNVLPLTAETRGLLGSSEFAQLRPGAVLINVGRGATVQTEALIAALTSGQLAGAGLDVTDPEPLPADHPLWRCENAIITPHYSGGRPDYLQRVTQLFLANLRRYSSGEPLENVVDVQAGY
jgi:D-2-hydroxyacid dehydrogenase (NADP+)